MIPQFKSGSGSPSAPIRDITLIPSPSGVSGNYGGTWEEGSLKLQYRASCFYSSIIIQIDSIVNLDIQLYCDSHEFSIAFCFGQSCRLETGKGNFMNLHDRGVSVMRGECNRYQISIIGNGNYLLIFLLYTKDFCNDQDFSNPLEYKKGISPIITKFLYNSPVICIREIMEHLSILLYTEAEDEMIEFLRSETIRNMFLEYFNPKTSRHFQPFGFSIHTLTQFYINRNKLLEIVSLPHSYPELLSKAGISNTGQFRKIIKELYGITTREYITELRMANTLNLLKDPSLSINLKKNLHVWPVMFSCTFL